MMKKEKKKKKELCKIDFYWSDFLFYDEKRKKEEKRVNGLQRAVKKLKKYQDEINEIYHLDDLKKKKNKFSFTRR